MSNTCNTKRVLLVIRVLPETKRVLEEIKHRSSQHWDDILKPSLSIQNTQKYQHKSLKITHRNFCQEILDHKTP